MSENTTTNCLNCEESYSTDFSFCPHCGQKSKDELTLSVLFYNTISNYFSFDARFLKSFFPLLFRPGYLASKFIAGKRLMYLHPAQLYLFVSVVFFFLFSFSVRKQVQSLDESLAKTLKKETVVDTITNESIKDSLNLVKAERKRIKDSTEIEVARQALKANKMWTGMNDAQIDSLISTEGFKEGKNNMNFNLNEKEIDSLIAAGASNESIYKSMGMDADDNRFVKRMYGQALKFYKSRKGGSVLQSFYDTIPIAMFFLLPIFAFILKIFYFRRGRYAHHLVFSFYYFSFLFTVFSIIVGANMIWDVPDWIDWLVAGSTFLYLFVALKKFYQKGWFGSFIKANVVTFTFLVVVIPMTAAILGLFAFMFY